MYSNKIATIMPVNIFLWHDRFFTINSDNCNDTSWMRPGHGRSNNFDAAGVLHQNYLIFHPCQPPGKTIILQDGITITRHWMPHRLTIDPPPEQMTLQVSFR
jgi:hypothetical protein